MDIPSGPAHNTHSEWSGEVFLACQISKGLSDCLIEYLLVGLITLNYLW
jgi:hypothetical protein